eukprot:GGOE01031169.1.p2 GENE.GGOE01031169.1~~GGOE01031169.1.p2  ORF type:complete len:169 (+),score=2.47 GGOE01031169.1:332-838(+)
MSQDSALNLVGTLLLRGQNECMEQEESDGQVRFCWVKGGALPPSVHCHVLCHSGCLRVREHTGSAERPGHGGLPSCFCSVSGTSQREAEPRGGAVASRRRPVTAVARLEGGSRLQADNTRGQEGTPIGQCWEQRQQGRDVSTIHRARMKSTTCNGWWEAKQTTRNKKG